MDLRVSHRRGLMLSMSAESKLVGETAWPSPQKLVDEIVSDINAAPVLN